MWVYASRYQNELRLATLKTGDSLHFSTVYQSTSTFHILRVAKCWWWKGAPEKKEGLKRERIKEQFSLCWWQTWDAWLLVTQIHSPHPSIHLPNTASFRRSKHKKRANSNPERSIDTLCKALDRSREYHFFVLAMFVGASVTAHAHPLVCKCLEHGIGISHPYLLSFHLFDSDSFQVFFMFFVCACGTLFCVSHVTASIIRSIVIYHHVDVYFDRSLIQ